MQIDLIENMFKVKEAMGPECWTENYKELATMFCYVFSGFTWIYPHGWNGNESEDKTWFKLRKIVPFL